MLTRRRRQAVAVALACASAAASLLAAGLTLDIQWMCFAGGALYLILYVAWCNGHGALFSRESRPLDGEGCLRLKRLADEDDRVMEFIRAINEQGRAFVWADLWVVNTWVRGLYQDEQVAACKALNRIGVSVA